jgi:predicted amidophosphoribosyltransferase
MFMPRSCPVCGALGAAPCASCAAGLRRAGPAPAPVGVDTCLALVIYEGVGRELVARLKYRNARSSVPFLARAMAAMVAGGGPFDVVTWAPTTAARRRERGFDQAELLARAVARRLGGTPCRALLLRPPGNPQTGQPLDVRRAGPAFHPARPAPARVLLVDDVVTSGATMSAAARALRSAGARHVDAVAVARTPRTWSDPGLHSDRVAVCGSVVESRRQSQAKRPT